MKSVATPCKICGSPSEPFAAANILHRYDITYYACPVCDFIQTEEPYWLAESYASAINRTDIGYAGRNLELSRLAYSLVAGLFDPRRRFLDYGGGYGLFVRMMRDKGLDWYWQDKFCENLFAQGFESEASDQKQFALVSSFEVMEHTVNPLQEIENMLACAPTILFSTLLIPRPKILPQEWWYYGLDHGQHISFFSAKSLQIIAERFRLHLWSKDDSLHLLSRAPIPKTRAAIFLNHHVSLLTNYLLRRRSLLPADFEFLKRQSSL